MNGGGASGRMNVGTATALNYLNGVDTSDFDAVNSNFQDIAKALSENIWAIGTGRSMDRTKPGSGQRRQLFNLIWTRRRRFTNNRRMICRPD